MKSRVPRFYRSLWIDQLHFIAYRWGSDFLSALLITITFERARTDDLHKFHPRYFAIMRKKRQRRRHEWIGIVIRSSLATKQETRWHPIKSSPIENEVSRQEEKQFSRETKQLIVNRRLFVILLELLNVLFLTESLLPSCPFLRSTHTHTLTHGQPQAGNRKKHPRSWFGSRRFLYDENRLFSTISRGERRITTKNCLIFSFWIHIVRLAVCIYNKLLGSTPLVETLRIDFEVIFLLHINPVWRAYKVAGRSRRRSQTERTFLFVKLRK